MCVLLEACSAEPLGLKLTERDLKLASCVSLIKLACETSWVKVSAYPL